MAKRFTDKSKWRDPWYRKLPVHVREFWEYLLDECNHAGIWKIDLDLASLLIGMKVSDEDIATHLSDRIIRLSGGRFFVPGYIKFQYGKLRPASSMHASVIRELEEFKIDPTTLAPLSLEGLETLKEKEEYKYKEEEEEKEEAAPQNKKVPFDLKREDIDDCVRIWRETLGHFKMGRDILASEQRQIAQAIQRQQSHKAVAFALEGARYQSKGPTFDPANFLNLARILDPENFNRFLNLGVAAEHERRKKAGAA